MVLWDVFRHWLNLFATKESPQRCAKNVYWYFRSKELSRKPQSQKVDKNPTLGSRHCIVSNISYFFFFFFGSTTDVGQGLPVPTCGLGFQWLIDSPHSRIVSPTYDGAVYLGIEPMTGMLLSRTNWRLYYETGSRWSSVTDPKIIAGMRGEGGGQMILQPRAPTTIFSRALVANTLSTCKHTPYYIIEIFGDRLVRLPVDPPLVHDGVFFYCRVHPYPCLQRMHRAGDSVAVCKLPGG